MIHFLRFKDEEGRTYTVVAAEAMPHDLRVQVSVTGFAKLLLLASLNDTVSFDRWDEIVDDFRNVQEMRGEWFERINCKESSDDFCVRKLKPLADKYTLKYVTGRDNIRAGA